MVEALRTMLQRAGFPTRRCGRSAASSRRSSGGRPARGVRADGTVTTERGKAMTTRLLVFDSGIGGLSVAREIAARMPRAEMVYVADDAGFPYGDWEDEPLTDRVVGLIGGLIDRFAPDARGDRLQHGLDAGPAAAPRALRAALRRHRAGDQAGGGADEIRPGQRARRPTARCSGTIRAS